MERNIIRNEYRIEELHCSSVGFLNLTEIDSYNVVFSILSNDTYVSLDCNLIYFLLLMILFYIFVAQNLVCKSLRDLWLSWQGSTKKTISPSFVILAFIQNSYVNCCFLFSLKVRIVLKVQQLQNSNLYMLESISCCLIVVEVICTVFSSLETSSNVWIDRFKRIIFLSFIS